jgi:hypothetical protein
MRKILRIMIPAIDYLRVLFPNILTGILRLHKKGIEIFRPFLWLLCLLMFDNTKLIVTKVSEYRVECLLSFLSGFLASYQ